MEKKDTSPAGDSRQPDASQDAAPSFARNKPFLNPATAPVPTNVSAAPPPPPPPPIPPAPAPAAPAVPPEKNPPPVSPAKPAESGTPGPAAAQPAAPGKTLADAKGLYDRLFPPASPQRKSGPYVVIAAVIVLLLLGKCAVSTVSHKISSASQARAEATRVRTTGVLVVKSNRPEATVEARRIATADDATTDSAKGALGAPMSGLAPGKYAVTLHAEGWPDAHGEVNVPAGQQTDLTIPFKSGSLRLDTVPNGATVRLGKALLGKTPVVIPQLPPGENQLSLEYPSWPAVPHLVTITENQEATASVRLPHGRLVVDSFPAGATVVLAGKAFNKTPLFFDPVAAGPHKLVLQAKDFPPMEVTVTVVDGGEVKIRPVLGSIFPVLDPAELLRAVWLPDDSKVPRTTTGIYRPKNDFVKNIRREWLYNNWLRKTYRFAGIIKAYDAANGRVEFAEQRSELSRFRVVAQVRPGTTPDSPILKDATLAVYGRLTAVEEPTWPGRVITLELSDAEFLPEGTP